MLYISKNLGSCIIHLQALDLCRIVSSGGSPIPFSLSQCDFCQHASGTEYHLREHIRVMHTHRDVKPFQCSYCDFRCGTSGNCNKHVKARHPGKEVRWVKVCEPYPKDNKPVLQASDRSGVLPATGSAESSDYGGIHKNPCEKETGTGKTMASRRNVLEEPGAGADTEVVWDPSR